MKNVFIAKTLPQKMLLFVIVVKTMNILNQEKERAKGSLFQRPAHDRAGANFHYSTPSQFLSINKVNKFLCLNFPDFVQNCLLISMHYRAIIHTSGEGNEGKPHQKKGIDNYEQEYLLHSRH